MTSGYKTFLKGVKIEKWVNKTEKKRKEKNDTVEQKGRRKQTEASVLEPSACGLSGL